MTRALVPVLIVAMLATAGVVMAHEYFEIPGTIVSYTDNVLALKKKEGETVSIRLDRQTVVVKDRQKMPREALTAGVTVVVDAYGDYEDGSLALAIRIVPPIAAR